MKKWVLFWFLLMLSAGLNSSGHFPKLLLTWKNSSILKQIKTYPQKVFNSFEGNLMFRELIETTSISGMEWTILNNHNNYPRNKLKVFYLCLTCKAMWLLILVHSVLFMNNSMTIQTEEKKMIHIKIIRKAIIYFFNQHVNPLVYLFKIP